jgi:ABC-type uncharacterized transport system auxiliary subunit
MVKTGASQSKGSASRVRRSGVLGLALLAALLSSACASTPKTRYYTLRTPPPPSVLSSQTHFTLQVERFDVPDLLLDHRIIYYRSQNELNFHEYHRWSSDPGEMLSDVVMKFFAETHLFQQVYAFPAPVKADYTLRGRVLDLSELKYDKSGRGSSGTALLGLKLDLLQTQQNKVVWSARLKSTAPIDGNDPEATVNAMSIATDRLFEDAYSGISQVVKHEVAVEQEQAH